MATNYKDNNNQNNLHFGYPIAIENTEDIEILDYNYNEMDFEKIDEELLKEFHDFEFKK